MRAWKSKSEGEFYSLYSGSVFLALPWKVPLARRRLGTWGPGRAGVPRRSRRRFLFLLRFLWRSESGPGREVQLPSGRDGHGGSGTWARGAGVPGGRRGSRAGRAAALEPRGDGDGGCGSRVRISPRAPTPAGLALPGSRPSCLTPGSHGTLPPLDSCLSQGLIL